MIVMVICCIGCALLFLGIGIWAEKSEKPVHFWSGTKIDPKKVTDIPLYNHACAVMWKLYSVPYWCSGVLSCMDGIDGIFGIASVVLLLAACIPGVFWLVCRYSKIEKQYIIR